MNCFLTVYLGDSCLYIKIIIVKSKNKTLTTLIPYKIYFCARRTITLDINLN
nr:MAG TPA: hypothetical protein [Caudoviricetes sp.]